jgi:hypothetical protein
MSFALSLLYAFLMLLLPLAEALYHGRSPGALLYLYWVESFALLILHPIRIFLHQRWTNATGHRFPSSFESNPSKKGVCKKRTISASASPFTYLRGFTAMVAIFTLAHGVFILLLVFLFKVSGPVPMNDLRAATMWGAGVPLGLFIVDLFRLRKWTFTQLQNTVGGLAARLLITQFGIIFGMVAFAVTKSPWALVGTFFVFRVLIDALMDWSKRTQHLTKTTKLPDRIAKLGADAEGKSVEQIQADYAAEMKAERDFQAMFDLPFDPKR